ncbi:hypothetical protein G6F37_000278 [Rhizopus arrhizus]|nr:hypothetical protein G6F38_001903 [Rhizopus arrhizus]KAG1164442.1 hypothetical protein G6F37_000278 [Rhizopus arrhizus]
MTTLYDFKIKDIMGNEWDLDELRGKVVMIVNVASKCSYVKQYSSLEEIYLRYKSQDFVIIGCPCNQFAGQEPAPETEIYNYCTIHWSVTFPLTSKLEVNGINEAPLYKWMKETMPGIFGLKRVKWNFEKFLIDREGKIVKRYWTFTDPKRIIPDIEKLL